LHQAELAVLAETFELHGKPRGFKTGLVALPRGRYSSRGPFLFPRAGLNMIALGVIPQSVILHALRVHPSEILVGKAATQVLPAGHGFRRSSVIGVQGKITKHVDVVGKLLGAGREHEFGFVEAASFLKAQPAVVVVEWLVGEPIAYRRPPPCRFLPVGSVHRHPAMVNGQPRIFGKTRHAVGIGSLSCVELLELGERVRVFEIGAEHIGRSFSHNGPKPRRLVPGVSQCGRAGFLGQKLGTR